MGNKETKTIDPVSIRIGDSVPIAAKDRQVTRFFGRLVHVSKRQVGDENFGRSNYTMKQAGEMVLMKEVFDRACHEGNANRIFTGDMQEGEWCIIKP